MRSHSLWGVLWSEYTLTNVLFSNNAKSQYLVGPPLLLMMMMTIILIFVYVFIIFDEVTIFLESSTIKSYWTSEFSCRIKMIGCKVHIGCWQEGCIKTDGIGVLSEGLWWLGQNEYARLKLSGKMLILPISCVGCTLTFLDGQLKFSMWHALEEVLKWPRFKNSQ